LRRERREEGDELNVARRGALLGETALIVEMTWPRTATAIEPTRVLRIPRSVFLRMLEGEQAAAQKLRSYIAARVGSAIDEIEALRPRFEVPESDHEEDKPGDDEPDGQNERSRN
jgi:CRP-like cAMP-binding protein